MSEDTFEYVVKWRDESREELIVRAHSYHLRDGFFIFDLPGPRGICLIDYIASDLVESVLSQGGQTT